MLTSSKGFNRWKKHISFKSGCQMSDRFYELTKKSQVVTEKYPIHCGTAVLHLSKLILLNFVKFLDDFLIKDSWEAVYTGINYITILIFLINFIINLTINLINFTINLTSIWPSIWSIWPSIWRQFDHQFDINFSINFIVNLPSIWNQFDINLPSIWHQFLNK